eukprot:6126230-Alexandrium_andersonii.AAC.1
MPHAGEWNGAGTRVELEHAPRLQGLGTLGHCMAPVQSRIMPAGWLPLEAACHLGAMAAEGSPL